MSFVVKLFVFDKVRLEKTALLAIFKLVNDTAVPLIFKYKV